MPNSSMRLRRNFSLPTGKRKFAMRLALTSSIWASIAFSSAGVKLIEKKRKHVRCKKTLTHEKQIDGQNIPVKSRAIFKEQKIAFT